LASTKPLTLQRFHPQKSASAGCMAQLRANLEPTQLRASSPSATTDMHCRSSPSPHSAPVGPLAAFPRENPVHNRVRFSPVVYFRARAGPAGLEPTRAPLASLFRRTATRIRYSTSSKGIVSYQFSEVLVLCLSLHPAFLLTSPGTDRYLPVWHARSRSNRTSRTWAEYGPLSSWFGVWMPHISVSR
jgi:hypothetical protein